MKKGSCTKSLFCLVLMVCCIFSWFPSGSVMTVAQAAEDAPTYTLSIEIEPGVPTAEVTIAQNDESQTASLASAEPFRTPRPNTGSGGGIIGSFVGGTLYLCAYNAAGALTDCEEQPCESIVGSQETVQYNFPTDAVMVKAFLWDAENPGNPLASHAEQAVPASPHASNAILRGTVVETNVSSLDYILSDNTQDLQYFQLVISEVVTAAGGSYATGQTVQFYADNLGAWQYLGQQVEVRLDDTGNVAAIEPLPLEAPAVSFTFDQYAGANTEPGAYALRYWADPTDDAPVSIPIADDAALVYNHAKGYYDFVDLFEENGLVSNWRSGRITVTQEPATGRQIVIVEIAATGVVEEIAENGSVSFKNVVGERQYNNIVRRLEFFSAEQKIYLTKDGQPFDWRQLQPWDVLSIVTNTDAGYYYTAEVLSRTITGTVDYTVESDTSADGLAYCIQGKTYDIAAEFFGSSMPAAGSEGIFTLDTYDRLCAFRSVREEEPAYGYILDAEFTVGTWNDPHISLQILDQEGEVWITELADSVYTENAYYNDILRGMYDGLSADGPHISVRVPEMDDEELESLVSALRGTLMTYRLDNAQMIDRLTLPADDSIAFASETLTGSSLVEQVFDAEDNSFRVCDVNEDTKIFFINGSGGSQTGPGTAAESVASAVGTAEHLTDGVTYSLVAYDVSDLTGIAAAVVVYNAQPDPPLPAPEPPEPLPTAKPDVATEGYAGLLDAVLYAEETAGHTKALVRLLTADGTAFDTEIANDVLLKNAYYNETLRSQYPELSSAQPDLADWRIDDESLTISTMLEELRGHLVQYQLNTEMQVSVLTLPAPAAEQPADGCLTETALTESDFDEMAATLGGLYLDAETPVFLLNSVAWSFLRPGQAADPKKSVVGTRDNLASETYEYFTYYTDDPTRPVAVVIFNALPAIRQSDSVVYIVSVGDAVYEGERCYYVTYYQDGVLHSAYTAPDQNNEDLHENTVPGSVFKFALLNDRIYSARTILTFEDPLREEIRYWDYGVQVNRYNEIANDTERSFFGAVIDATAGQQLKLQPVDPESGIIAFDAPAETIDLSGADIRYYLYYPHKPQTGRLAIGSAADLQQVDPALLQAGGEVYLDGADEPLCETPAYGMLDYAFVRQYQGEMKEVILYRAYAYGAYDVQF